MTALITIRAQLAAARASIAALEAAVTELEAGDADELLDVHQLRQRYATGYEAIRSAAGRGELEVVRGSRRRLLVRRSAIEAWLRSRPVVPRTRSAPANDLDSWDAGEAADLARARGGR